MANPLAALLAGLAGGFDKWADYQGRMSMAKQLAQMEDQILRSRQEEASQRDLEDYKQKLQFQAGIGMPEEYLAAIANIAAARRKPTVSSGDPGPSAKRKSAAERRQESPSANKSWLGRFFSGG